METIFINLIISLLFTYQGTNVKTYSNWCSLKTATNLNAAKSFGSKEVFAFLSYRIPRPFEQVNQDLNIENVDFTLLINFGFDCKISH